MAILKGIIMAINANDNGHTANDNMPYMPIRMAILAINNATNNGHKCQ